MARPDENREDDVAKLETMLGHSGDLDLRETDGPTGYYGVREMEAAQRFQKRNGLEPDGIVRPNGPTFRALAAQPMDLGVDIMARGFLGKVSVPEWLLLLVIVSGMVPALSFRSVPLESPGASFALEYAFRIAVIGLCLASAEIRGTIRSGLGAAGSHYLSQSARILGAIGAALFLFFVDVSIIELIGRILFVTLPEWRPLTHTYTDSAFLIMVDLTFGLALVAVSEEFLYRAGMRQFMERIGFKPWLVIVVSAIVFGLVHIGHGIPNAVTAMLTGMTYIFVFIRFNTLWPMILSHYLTNLWHFSAFYGLW